MRDIRNIIHYIIFTVRIPGGMVDAGEKPEKTLEREFCEEAASDEGLSKADQQEQRALLKRLFDNANRVHVYSGYIDDPRSTDNAWVETVAARFHCAPDIAEKLKLQAADDAKDVKWIPIDPENAVFY